MRTFLLRLAKDERGTHTMEVALSIALFALIAGFGFFAFGGSLADMFDGIGTMSPGADTLPPVGTNPMN